MDNKMSDLQILITGCKKQDAGARKKLYECYASAMMGICMRYVNEKETAKDLLQEGFIKVYTKIGSYSGNGSFEGWMKRIFITTALEYLRDDRQFYDTCLNESSEAVDHCDVLMIEKLSVDEILRYINELPTGFKTIFNMYVIEGYSHTEIAKLLNIKESTSRSQLLRARQLLQTKIKKLF